MAEDPEEWEKALEEAQKKGMVSLAGNCSRMAFCTGNKTYITTASQAASLLEDKNIEKYGFKLKDLMLPLWKQGISLAGTLWDPELMHYLINPERNHRPTDLAIQYLNYFPEEKAELRQGSFPDGKCRKL